MHEIRGSLPSATSAPARTLACALIAAAASLTAAPASACRERQYCFKADAGIGYMLLRNPTALPVTPEGATEPVGLLGSTGPMSLLSFAGGVGYGTERGLVFPFIYVSIDIPFNEPYPETATIAGVTYARRDNSTFHQTIDIAGIGVSWPVNRKWVFSGQVRPGIGRVGTVGGTNLESPQGDAFADATELAVHVDLRLCRRRGIRACFWLAPAPYEFTWLGSVTLGAGGHW